MSVGRGAGAWKRQTLYGMHVQVEAQLRGEAALPWEGDRLTPGAVLKLGSFCLPVLSLLQRDPANRGTVQSFLEACNDIVSSQTTTSMHASITVAGA